MTILSPSPVTLKTSVLVDFRSVIWEYSPLRCPAFYLYQNSPWLSTVMNEVTVEKVIELVFVNPPDSLNHDDVILWEYIEHRCPRALALFEQSLSLAESFNFFVELVIHDADMVIRRKFAEYLPSVDYGEFVFETWVDSTTALMIPVAR